MAGFYATWSETPALWIVLAIALRPPLDPFETDLRVDGVVGEGGRVGQEIGPL